MYTPTNLELYFLKLVNQLRAKVGVNPLTFDGDLLKSSDAHSAWMAKTDTFSHTGVNGTNFSDRMSAAGYGWQMSGENIAWRGGALDEATVRALHDQFVNSPPHYANLINGSFTEIGIGLKLDAYGVYVTQNFGVPNASEAAEADDVGNPNVSSSKSLTLRGDTEKLTLTGKSSIKGTGNNLDNILLGNSGANTLKGQGGNDTLNGNAGKDILTGGSGRDAFVFDTAKEANGDTITDFSKGNDGIILWYMDADSTQKGNQAFSFIGDEAFHSVAGEVRAYQSGNKTYVAGDTNGDGRADFTVKLNGLKALAATDFVL